MSKRPITSFACLLGVLVIAFFYFYAPVPAIFEYVSWHYHATPESWIVPTPLMPGSEPNLAAVKLNYFGYEFESPTTDVKEERSFASGVFLNFSQCVGVMIIKPSSADGLLSTLGKTPESKRYIQNMMGQDATASNYALRSAVLNQTPNDVRLWSSPRQMARNSMLLSLKRLDSELFKSGLYSFRTPWMSGFQEGSLVGGHARIEAFDHQDRLLTLMVAPKPGKSCFTQAQLNQIIFSLRPVPVS